jgi:hypothetical protein
VTHSGKKQPETGPAYKSEQAYSKKNYNYCSNAASYGNGAVKQQSGKEANERQQQMNLVDFEMDSSSAGRINQLSAPGSVSSSKPKQFIKV